MSSVLPGTKVLSLNLSMFCMIYVAANLTFTCGYRSHLCANRTLTSDSGKLLSHTLPEVSENYLNCWTQISVTNASLIEINFQMFFTNSFGDLYLMNEMCTREYLELVTSDKTLKICGNWTGREDLLSFVFQTSDIFIRFHGNQQNENSIFIIHWTSTKHTTGSSNDPCKLPLFETETSCFELVEQPEDWVTGHNSCRRRGATLARVDHPDTHHALTQHILKR